MKDFAAQHGFKTWARELEQAVGGPATTKATAKVKASATGDLFGAEAADAPEVPPESSVETHYDTVTDDCALSASHVVCPLRSLSEGAAVSG